MKKVHSVRFCKIRKFSVSKGIIKWVPKNSKSSKDSNDPINANGPKFVRGPKSCYLILFLCKYSSRPRITGLKDQVTKEMIRIGLWSKTFNCTLFLRVFTQKFVCVAFCIFIFVKAFEL